MKPLLIALLLSFSTLSFASEIPDTPANRKIAAERYMTVVSMENMMSDVITQSAKNIPEQQRSRFINLMTQYVRLDVLKRQALSSMIKHFSVKELNALADFYGSPEGQSAVKKLGVFMADVTPLIQQEIFRAAKQLKADSAKKQ